MVIMNSDDYSEKREGYVSVDGGQIYYEVKGTGPAIVLIHSAISDCRVWDLEFEHFSQNYTVVRYDVRGLGKSSPATQPYTDSSDLKVLLASLGISGVSIIASSNSGRIALDFALKFPDQVNGLVLVGSGLGLFDPEGEEELAEEIPELEESFSRLTESYRGGKTNESVEELLKLFASGLTGENIETARKLVSENLEEIITEKSAENANFQITGEKLKHIDSKVLVLVGNKDNPVIIWSSKKLAEEIPHASLKILAGGDHFLNLSSKEEFIKAVSDFLEN